MQQEQASSRKELMLNFQGIQISWGEIRVNEPGLLILENIAR